MKFVDFVCFEAIILGLNAADRDGVIAELAAALDQAGQIPRGKRREIINAVIERENEASTGLGKGIAVPHVKYKAVKKTVAAIGQSSAGIDFSSLDKQPVYSVILLLSPVDEPDKHLQAMENIFRHLQQDKFRRFLRQSRTVEDVKDLLQEADENPLL
ncbi:MAG: PTS sugar transporter subunit IIA [Planctomycetota bacterium]|jgi:mannitol/fructose-specific phosphotransferase system IIA component (Ntr-type)